MKHTILFLAANPWETDRIALDREARAIQIALDRARYRDAFEFVTWWATQPMDLLDELRRRRPTVVHFSGHGGRHGQRRGRPTGVGRDVGTPDDADTPDNADDQAPKLVFHAPDGAVKLVSAEALRDAFGAAGASTKLVVLNACYTEAAADALRGQVDCVVGMTRAIPDDAATSFAVGFYAALADGESVASAYRHGRAATRLDGLRDEDCPQLRVRDSADSDRLVLAEAARSRRLWFAGVSAGALAILASGAALLYRGHVDSPASVSEMANFSAATFQMGSTPEEIQGASVYCHGPGPGCRRELFDREGPVRTVSLSPFAIDRTEVTNQAFAHWLSGVPAVVDGRLVRMAGAVLVNLDAAELEPVATGFVARRGVERHPVAGVSPEAAGAYCAAQDKRLPTEAEWEYAARGTARRQFAWGDVPDPAKFGCALRIGKVRDAGCPDPRPLADVGATAADVTPEGVYDLAGNVSEWVADRFAERYPPCDPCRDPKVTDGEGQVIRGGNHVLDASVARAAARSRSGATAAASHTGFRCARSR
jgi:formylglycine-generating enzyme required for sulfatase activity